RNLIKPELAALQDPHGTLKAMVGPASYLVGAAAAWVSIPAAFAIYALTPLFYITPPKFHGVSAETRGAMPKGAVGWSVRSPLGARPFTLVFNAGAACRPLGEVQPGLRQREPEGLVTLVRRRPCHPQAVFGVGSIEAGRTHTKSPDTPHPRVTGRPRNMGE